MSIKNSQRSTNNTYIVTASVFPRVRKDNNSFFVEQDLLHNKEAWKYQKEFFPTKEWVLKNMQYIQDYLMVYDAHKMTETTQTGEKKPKEPVGWVTNVCFSDKYSDNERWYTGLIFTMRLPKDRAHNIMAKYNQTSLYGLHYSISYEPEVSWFLVDGVKKPKITGVKFREVSLTNDPCYPLCKTIQIFNRQNSNINIPGLIEKKNYIVNWDGKIEKVELEMDKTKTTIPNPGTPLENKVTKPPPQTTPQVTPQQTTPPSQPVNAQANDKQKINLQMLKDEYKINLLDFEKNKNNPEYLLKKIEELTGPLLNNAKKEQEKREQFVKSRDIIMENTIKNYEKVSKELLKREVSKKDKDDFMDLLYQGDIKETVDYLISLQNKVLENSNIPQKATIPNTTPLSNIQVIPEGGGLLSNSSFIIKDTVDEVVVQPCQDFGYYDIGSPQWKNQRARNGYSSGKSWKKS